MADEEGIRVKRPRRPGGRSGRKGSYVLALLARQQGKTPEDVLRGALAESATNKEAAERLGVDESTMSRWVKAYNVQFVRE